jgi:hypothetical protein
MGWRHPKAAGGLTFEIEFDQHRGFGAHHPTIVSRLNHHNLGRCELPLAAVGVFDMNLSPRQKADVRVHAQIRAGGWFHVSRPAKSGLVDDALDPAIAGANHIKLNSIQIAMLGSFKWSEQWIVIAHFRILDCRVKLSPAATPAERSILSDPASGHMPFEKRSKVETSRNHAARMRRLLK